MRNQMIQTFTRDKGDLFQIKGDVDHDFDGFLSNIAGGVRYARRSANERSVVLNSPVPGGNLGAPDEAEAVKVSDTGLPADYVTLGPVAPDLNGGARFYVPNPDFLLSESGLDAARAYFGLPPGQRSEEHTSELPAIMRIPDVVFCL